MRQQFVPSPDAAQPGEPTAETREDVFDICPWAAEVIDCEGGWQAFESVADATTWRNQI
jgi:hypothetical protein